MTQSLRCPACATATTETPSAVRCAQGHELTAIGLALATNRNTVLALWTAIRALEDDAAGLDHLARSYPDLSAGERRREAAEARQAAQRLRAHATTAQLRLDALDQDVADYHPQ